MYFVLELKMSKICKERENYGKEFKLSVLFTWNEGLMAAKIPFFQQETHLHIQKQTSEVSETWDQAPLLPPGFPESEHIRLASLFYPSPRPYLPRRI